jgi:opacity protein-like surface antigen
MRPASVVFLLLSFLGAANAQVGEIALSFGQSLFKNNKLGFADAVTQYQIDDGFRFAARLTLNTKRFLGHEFGYSYSHPQLAVTGGAGSGMGVHQGFYDLLLYVTPEGTRVRPFVAGGGQFSTFVPPGASVTYGQGTTKYGFNYGAGLKVRLTSMFAVRFDVRDYETGKPFDLINRSGLLHQIEASAGIGIFF